MTYANLEGWTFNEHKQYAFFRKHGKELLLIVVNFDEMPARCGINIPPHAFEYLSIPQNESYLATDLLTHTTESICLASGKLTHVSLEGHSGKILKIKL